MNLLTWNIQWGCGVDGRVDLDRIVSHARRMADFDVLCLQEVSDGYPELRGGDGSDQFAGLAERLPGYAAIDGVATDTMHPSGGRRRFGNMMLSRLPVLQVFRHLLPWPAEPATSSMQRVALEVTLESRASPLRVTTTHLEYYSAAQRLAQIERLRELHGEAVGHSRNPRPDGLRKGPFAQVARAAPAVLVGDFNCRPASIDHARLLAPFDHETPAYCDAWTHCHPGRDHAPTVGLFDTRQWPGGAFACDFVFVSQDLVSRIGSLTVDPTTDASDHQPLALTLRDA